MNRDKALRLKKQKGGKAGGKSQPKQEDQQDF